MFSKATIATDAVPTVLLVEDTVALVRLYMKFLGSRQAEIVAVETLAAARDFIAAHVPVVMLLDINLPDGDGLDLLRDIRARKLDTAIVVIAANGSIDRAVAAMRAGADDFLIKPFPPERLSTTLELVLERRRLARIVATMAPAVTPASKMVRHAVRSLADVERETIENAIAACDGNLTEAARRLDINASTIYRKRQNWLARAS